MTAPGQVLLEEAVRAASQAGAQAGADAAPLTRPAIVASVDPTNVVAMVQLDGPNQEAFGAMVAAPITVFPGDRVLVLFVPPHGCYVIGVRGGDNGDWRTVGEIDAPFGTGWEAASGTTLVNFSGPGVPMFTRRSALVELRGRAERTSGSGTTVFTLPQDCWPGNDLITSALTSLGAHTPLSIGGDGVVSVASGVTLVIMDGITFHSRVPAVEDP